jgi:hypothetical protein
MVPGIALINSGNDLGEPLAGIGSIGMIAGFIVFGIIALRATSAQKGEAAAPVQRRISVPAP